MKTLISSLASVLFLLPSVTFAWGIRGHESICTAAAKLVRHAELATYLNQKSAKIGYLCDVPDLQWRVMSQNYKEHRLNPENLGLALQDLPLNYKAILDQYPGHTKILGSNWWRAEQFYRRAVTLKTELKNLQAPGNPAREFLMNLGYMGHFVGDVSQPLHSTADYDGYAVGHGGIHFYYEENVVHFIPGDLPEKIVAKAKEKLSSKNSNELIFLTEATPLLKIRALSILSHPDEKLIFALDPLTKISSMERGLSLPAERAPASSAAQAYEPMILNEMANSALLLAQLWDAAYEEVGRPKLSEAPPIRLPLVFGFVTPDYL